MWVAAARPAAERRASVLHAPESDPRPRTTSRVRRRTVLAILRGRGPARVAAGPLLPPVADRVFRHAIARSASGPSKYPAAMRFPFLRYAATSQRRRWIRQVGRLLVRRTTLGFEIDQTTCARSRRMVRWGVGGGLNVATAPASSLLTWRQVMNRRAFLADSGRTIMFAIAAGAARTERSAALEQPQMRPDGLRSSVWRP